MGVWRIQNEISLKNELEKKDKYKVKMRLKKIKFVRVLLSIDHSYISAYSYTTL